MFRLVKLFELEKLLPTDFVIISTQYLEFAVDKAKRLVIHSNRSGDISEEYKMKNTITEKTII